MADDTSGLIDALGLDHPTLFGWSTGGEIGLALAVRHPGQLGPLVVSGRHRRRPGVDADATRARSPCSPPPTRRTRLKLLDELFTPSGAAARDAYVQGLLSMPADEVSPGDPDAARPRPRLPSRPTPTVADGLELDHAHRCW